MSTTTDERIGDDLDEELGNGTSIEDRAAAGEAEEEDDGQFVIPGYSTGLTLSAGGRKPDVSEAKLATIPLAIKGQFAKGDELRLVVDVVCAGVNIVDERKDGQVQRTRRVHRFSPLAVEVLSEVEPE